MGRNILFRGANWAAFKSREPEVLLAGPAGSGKSLVWLTKLFQVADNYPGCRLLICRKARTSLTETGLVTFERDVLGPTSVILTRNPTLRRVRQSYRHPNGSEIIVGGMDKPEKVLSAEYDIVYCQEATDLTVADWETLSGRLRSGVVLYQQIVGDCNPTTPTHWLYKRQAAGVVKMFSSTHRDNPRYWDRAADSWTPDGAKYISRLSAFTGARRARFLEGKWAAAEGLVYDGYDPQVHLLPEGWVAPSHWQRLWSLDFGYTNPLVLQFWALDGDGRMYLTREYVRTKTMVQTAAEWAARLLESGSERRPVAVVCDHDPENAAVFERYSGCHTTPAEKFDKFAGIQQVQGRFDIAGDGKPRIYISPGAMLPAARDAGLVDAGKPCGLAEELLGYVWSNKNPDRPKDEPDDKDDHSCDAALYAVRWADAHSGGSACYGGPTSTTPFDTLPRDTFDSGGRRAGEW
jgi:phage terminase large subunit